VNSEKPLYHLQNIDKLKTKLELIQLTAEQIIKDFGEFNFTITFSGNEQSAYHELTVQTTEIIKKLYKNEFTKLQSLLYRIDVNEKLVNEALKMGDISAISQQISHLIVEKSFMKVVYRKYYHE
jgi:hypothetical protein